MSDSPTRDPSGAGARTGSVGWSVILRRTLVFAGVPLLLLAFATVLFAGRIAAPIGEWLITRSLPWPGATVEIGAVEFNGPGGLSVTDLRLTPDARGDALVVAGLEAEFTLRDLLRAPRRIRVLRVSGLEIEAVRRESGWGWFDVPPSSAEPSAESGGSGPALIIDRVELDGASLLALEDAGALLLRVDPLDAFGGSIEIGSSPAFDVEAATLRLESPGWTDGAVSIDGRVGLTGGAWQIGSVGLHDGSGGRLDIRGTVGPRDAGGLALNLEVTGDSFHVARMHPALAGVFAPDLRAGIDAELRGTTGRPEINARIDFADAGRLEAVSSIDPGGGAAILHVRADLTGLDVARLTERPFGIGPIDGVVSASLDISVPDSLDGPAEVELRTRARGQPVSLVGNATFVRGEARLALDASWPDASGRVAGRIRPIGAVPGYALDIALTAPLPLPDAVVDRQASLSQPFSLTTRIEGEGFEPDSIDGWLRGELRPATPAAGSLAGRFEGRMAAGSLDFSARLDLDGGTLEAAGTVPLSKPAAGWRLGEVRGRNLALAPWVGVDDAGRADLTASAAAAGDRVDAGLVIDSIMAGRLDGLAGALDVTVSGGRTHMSGRLTRDRSVVEIDAFELTGGRPDRADLSFVRLDPSLFHGGLPQAELSGRLTLDPLPAEAGPAAGIAGVNVAGRFDLLSGSSLGGQPIGGGADLRVTAGAIDFVVDLAGPDQSMTLAGEAEPAAEPFRLQLDRGAFRNVDLSLWSGGRLGNGRLNGSLRGEVTGLDPTRAMAQFAVTVDSSDVGRFAVDHGIVSLELQNGRASVRGTGHGRGRVGDIAINARLQTRSWTGEGALTLVDSAFDSAADTFRLDLAFTTPDSAAGTGWSAELDGAGPLIAVRLDTVSARIGLADGVLSLDRFDLIGDDVRLSGGGEIPVARSGNRPASLSIEGTATDLAPVLLAAGLPGQQGRARLSFRSSGPASALRHELRLGVAGLRGGAVELDSVDVTVAAASDTARWLSDVTAHFDAMANGAISFTPGGAPLVFGLGTAATNGEATPTRLAADAEWNAREPASVRLTGFTALLDAEQWELESPAVVSWTAGVEVTDLRLRSPSGVLSADGRVDRNGEQAFEAEVRALPIHVRRTGSAAAFGRTLDFGFRLTGPAAQPRLVFDGALQPVDTLRGGQISVSGDWTPERLQLRLDNPQLSGGRVTMEGTVPLRLTLAPERKAVSLADDAADLTLTASAFDLSAVATGLDGRRFRDLAGRLNADVRITGETQAPQFEGSVAVDGFSLTVEPYGTSLASDRLAVTLAGDRATITDAVIRSGTRGAVTLDGGVEFLELTVGNIAIDATFDRFVGADSRELEAILSGDITVGGTLDSPLVQGQVHVDQATYAVAAQDVPGDLEAIELTEADHAELERRFGIRRNAAENERGGFYRAATIDLGVAFESNVWARRAFEPSLAIELAGDLRLSKTPDAEMEIDGTIEVVEGRSYIEEFGRQFSVADGTIRFNGPPETIELEATATYTPNEDATIRLEVAGNADGFSLELGSDPEMSQTDIVSYIAVGRPASDVQRMDANMQTDAAAVGAGIALSRVAGNVELLARQALGLDVVEIQQDGLKGLTLVAGRYVTRQFYLGFRQPVVLQPTEDASFGIDETELDAEYRMTSWLLANLSGSRSLARFFLGARYAY